MFPERLYRPALWLGAAGLATWAGFVWNFTRELETLTVLWPPVLALLLGTGISLGVVAFAVALDRDPSIGRAAGARVVAWAVGSAAVFVAIRGAAIAIKRLEGRPTAEPTLDLLLSGGGGLLAGSLVGLLFVRSRQDATSARRRGDALAVLQRTLRHELRNGLNVVAGRAEQLRAAAADSDGSAPGSATGTDGLETIRDRSEEMADLLADTGALAGTFAGTEPLEPVDASRVVRERTRAIAAGYPDADVTVDVEDGVDVRANETLRFVVENLVRNAISHTDRERPAVTVSLASEDRRAVLRVADDGPGIPEELVERIEAKRATDGFGLVLVARLIEYYGGELTIGENEPRGAVVTARLPLADAPQANPVDDTTPVTDAS